MKINIIETEDYINFTNAIDRTDIIFQILKEEIAETLVLEDKIYSKWINQLVKMDWATTEIFYLLAVIIQRAYPDTNIKWVWQFFEIESEEYNHREYHKNNTYPENEFTFESFSFALKYLIPDVNKKYIDKISGILAEKFESYNLNPNFDS